ncbi:hypothetical protein [Qipengyuania algicida]|uniref:hypothetical protein n=1 Tax=Qipengyuania algicida TaxID=1836209 RepID=UPI0019288710|nr:hypothetical protein [Qipengyuania algicida]
MAVIGCLLLVILPIVGGLIGGWLGGSSSAIWGAGIGFVIALAISGFAGFALVKAGRER